ncbi:FAD:protein FMN transferase [Allopusillimonas ginsengisoli]|uniref:FAD:protein FMN transferase n=1 Tax=Allopusillimonas ginsengisoli TaxID=453575 RepID=UPI00102232FF|nr:FAD:protein FMN transferase [Allopusillimonas ginsengisoli]
MAWLLVAACPVSMAAGLAQLSGESMGTRWSVNAVLPVGVTRSQAQSAVQTALDQVVAHMSTWEAESDISKLNRAPAGWQAIPKPFFSVLDYALRLAQETHGAYDPTIGPLVDAWGFGAEKRPHQPPSSAELTEARALVGWRRLRLDADTLRVHKQAGTRVDLSSVAKGFGVDQAARALDTLGIHDYLVEVGGELRGRGQRPDGQPWHVAIEQPGSGLEPAVAAVISLNNLSVATSGDYRRFFRKGAKRYAHIIDPRTGYPLEHALVSVTVVHPDCMQADALSTALTVLGPDQGMNYARQHKLAALFMISTANGLEPYMTPEFKALSESR